MDSFKLDFPTYPSSELNEMSTEETSGDEQELNEMSRGKKWGGNTNNYNHKHSSFSNNHGNSYKQQQHRTSRKQTSQTVGTMTKRLQDHLDTGVRPLCTY